MIIDFINNWNCYSKGNREVWREAFDFIASVNIYTEEKKYFLRGDEMFAMVQGYETKPILEGDIEIHRRYADIHSLILGNESVYYSPIKLLEQKQDFTPTSDDVLYSFQQDQSIPFHLSPGIFALFFPEEGHMPAINNGRPEKVKKVLIKIDKKLLL